MVTSAAPPVGPVLVEKQPNGVLLARLNRPERRNALDEPAIEALERTLVEAEQTGVPAIVLTGGDEFFSSGGDLTSMPDATAGLLGPSSRLTRIHRLVERLRQSPVIVVAAVEGYAVGAAWGLALACDLIVAAEDAEFRAPFARRGLTADAGVAHHLNARLGRHRAASVLLLSEPLPAADAHAAGLVTRLCARGDSTEAALGIAAELAQGPRESNAVTKRLLTVADQAAISFHATEQLAVALVGHGRDAAEGRSAFLEKRRPEFSS